MQSTHASLEAANGVWIVVTPLVSVFSIVLSRAGQVAKDSLDPDSEEGVISGCYGAYSWLKDKVWQVCWALRTLLQLILIGEGIAGGIQRWAVGYRFTTWPLCSMFPLKANMRKSQPSPFEAKS